MATHLYIELQFMYVPKDKNHITYRGSITHILNFLNSTTTTIPPQNTGKFNPYNSLCFSKTECRIFIPYSCFYLFWFLGKSYKDLEGGIRRCSWQRKCIATSTCMPIIFIVYKQFS